MADAPCNEDAAVPVLDRRPRPLAALGERLPRREREPDLAEAPVDVPVRRQPDETDAGHAFARAEGDREADPSAGHGQRAEHVAERRLHLAEPAPPSELERGDAAVPEGGIQSAVNGEPSDPKAGASAGDGQHDPPVGLERDARGEGWIAREHSDVAVPSEARVRGASREKAAHVHRRHPWFSGGTPAATMRPSDWSATLRK